MKKLFRRIQFLSNIATIVIAIVLSLMFIRQVFFPAPQEIFPISDKTLKTINEPPVNETSRSRVTPIGKSVPLENINWKDNKTTLVLYISTKCRFCTESGPFYQRLVKENSKNDIKIIAVLPQSEEEGRKYLKDLGVEMSEVYSSKKLAAIGVTATPTLLLIDNSGSVSETWRGKLSSDKETEVLTKVFS